MKFSSLGAPAPVPVAQSFAISISRTTVSLTYVSTGFGTSTGIAGAATGKFFVFGQAILSSDTAADGAGFGIFYNTTGVPANGTGIGTDLTAFSTQMTEGTAAQQFTLTGGTLVTVTLGIVQYFYIGFKAVTGGTASIIGLSRSFGTVLETAAS